MYVQLLALLRHIVGTQQMSLPSCLSLDRVVQSD